MTDIERRALLGDKRPGRVHRKRHFAAARAAVAGQKSICFWEQNALPARFALAQLFGAKII